MTICAIYAGRQQITCTRGSACRCTNSKTLTQFKEEFDGITISMSELAKEMIKVDDVDLQITGQKFIAAQKAMLDCLENNYIQCNLNS